MNEIKKWTVANCGDPRHQGSISCWRVIDGEGKIRIGSLGKAHAEMIAGFANRAEAAEADNAALLELLRSGAESDEDDDIWATRVLTAIHADHPGAALLERLRAADVLAKAAERLRPMLTALGVLPIGDDMDVDVTDAATNTYGDVRSLLSSLDALKGGGA